MTRTLTDQDWEEIDRLAEILEKNPMPENMERKITRLLFGMPEQIPMLFDAERKLRKKRIGNFQNIIENTNADPDKEPALFAMVSNLKLIIKQTEEDISLLDLVEAIALHQIELRKDVKKITKLASSGKNQTKQFQELYSKMKKKEQSEREDTDYKKYMRIMKDEFDLEAKDTTEL
ncbi:MAG: hypothetical protein K5777_08335 [Nitrosopumilus sp.]|nr:hypothetical protein [Nitrosopumilus sp.]